MDLETNTAKALTQSTNYYSINSLDNLSYFTDSGNSNHHMSTDYNNIILKYLTETEIKEILEKVISRNSDKLEIKRFLTAVVRGRHFSEEFLIEYINYISKSSILERHDAEVLSGEYSTIALMFKTEESLNL